MLDFTIFSPVEEIQHPLLKSHDVRVFIKRDDMIHPFISGNKWRKLKHQLIRAQKEQKRTLVTFGGSWSNHLLATACASAKFGFKSIAFVRGEAVDNEVLFLCKLFGMELRFTSRERYKDKKSLFNASFEHDTSAVFIDEGGSGDEAVKGCAEIVYELPDEYDHIFCAAGTGTTAAGIINGIQAKRLSTIMNIVPVLKGANFLMDEINQLTPINSYYRFHEKYHFGGYAKTQPVLIEFIKKFTASTGIMIDPVYTGKMMYAIFDLIKDSHFTPGSKILAVHTGGLFGLLGMKEKFNFT